MTTKTNLTKLVTVLILSTIVARTRNPEVIFLMMITLLAASKYFINSKRSKKRIGALFSIGIFIMIFQIIFNRSDAIALRLYTGFLHAAKIFDLSMIAFIYISTTSPKDIAATLSFLPGTFRLALTVTFSLIPVIFEEYEKIRLVQSARGFKQSAYNPAANIIPLVIPLLHRILKRAEQLSLVIYTRGYKNV